MYIERFSAEDIVPPIGISIFRTHLLTNLLYSHTRHCLTFKRLPKLFVTFVDALFDRSTSKYPPQEDLLAGSLSYGQSSLLVPAQLKLILGNRTANFQVGLCGFYSYLLRSDLTDHEQGVTERVRILPTDQYGLTWSLSVRLMEKLSMGCSFYYAFNGYNDKLSIDTKRRSSLFNVSYLF